MTPGLGRFTLIARVVIARVVVDRVVVGRVVGHGEWALLGWELQSGLCFWLAAALC